MFLEGKKQKESREQVSHTSLRKTKNIQPKDWHTLDADDVRVKFYQNNENGLHGAWKQSAVIFDMESWLHDVG